MTVNDIALEIERAILAGRFGVGEKLPSERNLSLRFGVSRPILREALRTLAERQLVEVQPGRGAFVRGASATDGARSLARVIGRQAATPRQVVEARVMLEREAAYLAADRATSAELKMAEEALELLVAATGPIERSRADIRFHALLARMSHNPVIETMFFSIVAPVFDLMLSSVGEPSVVQVTADIHRAICESIAAHDGAAARAAIDEHFRQGESLYREDPDQPLEVATGNRLRAILGSPAATEAVLREALADLDGITSEDGE